MVIISWRTNSDGNDGIGEVTNMRWGDPLIGRIEMYLLLGVAGLTAAAYVVRRVVE